MVDHKQATEVTIASTADESGFSAWVMRWWKVGVAGLLVGSAALIGSYYQENTERTESYATWEVLGERHGGLRAGRVELTKRRTKLYATW